MLLDMCLQGSAMTIVVLTLRALFFKRLPKAAFYALRLVVLVRLLVPVQIEAPFNAWTMLDRAASPHVLALAPTQTPSTETPSAPPQTTSTGVGTGGAVLEARLEPIDAPAGSAEAPHHVAGSAASTLAETPVGHQAAIHHSLPGWQVAWGAGTLFFALGFAAAYAHQRQQTRIGAGLWLMSELRLRYFSHPQYRTFGRLQTVTVADSFWAKL